MRQEECAVLSGINERGRDGYVDFLRAFGLLLLIGVHVKAPDWYAVARSFDVPLMVFVSAMCYKSLRGGYLEYFKKRLARIYLPVFVFLTIFFGCLGTSYLVLGVPEIEIGRIVGSYLMLNTPSIGYVWVMRVFLMMALLLPLIEPTFRHANTSLVLLSIFGIVVIQHFLVMTTDAIPDATLRFMTDETVLYAVGYTPLVILGAKIRQYTLRQNILVAVATVAVIAIFMTMHNWQEVPQDFKYPPQSLYILYGLLACSILWMAKPLLARVTSNRFFAYLSRQSMWIYLWHIIPVYALDYILGMPGSWGARYLGVVLTAILFERIWHLLMSHIRLPLSKYLL